MAKRQTGLGRGLDALLDDLDVQEPQQGGVLTVSLYDIDTNPDQPRKTFDPDKLNELAASLRRHGMVQPLLVRKNGLRYTIVAGERRYRAARLAGLKTVPIVLTEADDDTLMELSLVENIQRENLNPIEEAQAYQKLIDEYHVKHEELAERVSKSRSFITNSMRLLKLQKQVQDMVIEGVLSSGHARAILGLPIAEDQLAAANRVVDEGMSVRQTEIMVKDWYRPKPVRKVATQSEKQNQLFYKELEKKLSTCTETKVKIKDNGKNKGKIEIEYYTLEDLERIQAILEGKSKNE
jgi:ParB family chromosome partitioning protein